MPTLPEALRLAEQALASGDLPRARFIFEQVLQAMPDEPHALTGMGLVEFRSGRLAEAEQFHRRAIARYDGNPTFHDHLFLVYYQQGRAREAADCCRRSIELDERSATAHNNLGIALRQCGQVDEAIASLRRAIALQPAHVDAHFNLANALLACDRLEEAEAEFCRAIEIVPHDVQALNNLAALRQLAGRYDEAMTTFDEAVRQAPQSAEARHNRAILQLLRGDCLAAWDDYQLRWHMPGAQPPSFAQPMWEGEPLAGRTILLWGEQGLGDVIQMIRYAPLVKQQGATVLLECQPALRALLATVLGVDRIVDTQAAAERFDCFIPLLSLPRVFGTSVETIPSAVPYVHVEQGRIEHWRRQTACDARLRVGIAWQGNPAFPADKHRSIPLAQFAPLAECPGVRLFSLQKGAGREQLASCGEQLAIVDLGATLDASTGSTADAAAAIRSLDLVVTCDTMLAHLAGALAVPVWVALPFSPNWRWLLERADSPWYPTMRLFRQPRLGDWPATFAHIAAELRSLAIGQVIS